MKYKNYIKLAALLPLLALLGCEANETPGAENQETVPVTIRLGLEKDGLSTRADDDDAHHADELEEEKEIHSLDIYIVNSSGNIEETLSWEETDGKNPEEISFTTTLTTGSKTVYALANLEEEYSEEDIKSIIANPSIELPRSAIDHVLEHKHIPMSAYDTWNVTTTQKTYSIELVRMVAKMNVTIIDERKERQETRASGTSSLTIHHFLPHSTNLFRIGEEQVAVPEETDFSPWTWDDIQFESMEWTEGESTMTVRGDFHDEFYLHESTPTDKETFDFTFTDEEGKVRRGAYAFDVPRNRIFPLVVHITDYRLQITGTCYLAAIGTEPFPVDITKGINGYTVSLPEGCSNVDIDIKLLHEGNEVQNVNWSYTESGDTEYLKDLTINNTDGLSIVSEKLIALPIGSKTFHLDPNLPNVSAFDVTIKVRELGNTEWTKSANTSPEQPLIIEL